MSASSFADQTLLNEPFSYSNGNLTLQSGGAWHPWGSGGDATVVNGAVRFEDPTDVIRAFPSLLVVPGEKVTFAFDITVDAANTADAYAIEFEPASAPFGFGNTNYGSGISVQIDFFTSQAGQSTLAIAEGSGTFSTDNSLNQGGSAGTLSAGVTHAVKLVLMRDTATASSAALVVNGAPPAPPPPPSNTTYRVYVDDELRRTGRIMVNDPRGINSVEMDQAAINNPGDPAHNALIDNLQIHIENSPATDTVTKSPVRVTFLQEQAAKAGSLKLVFDDGVTSRVLTLADAQAALGLHRIAFDPANPTASPEIVDGPTIPDGTYSVTLAFLDSLDNPVTGFTSTNVKLDTTPPALSPITIASGNGNPAFAKYGDTITVSFSASEALQNPIVMIAGFTATVEHLSGNNWTGKIALADFLSFPQGVAAFSVSCSDSLGNLGTVTTTTDSSSVVIDTIGPMIDWSQVPITGYVAGTLLPDLRGFLVVSDAGGAVTVSQDPPPGTVISTGLLVVEFVGTDPAGNMSQIGPVLTTDPGLPLAASGDLVTNSPIGATYAAFGTPKTGAFAGSIQVGRVRSRAIFAADGSLLLKQGGNLTGLTDTVISKLGQPSGDAVLVTLKPGPGGISGANNVVLMRNLGAGLPTVAARTGTSNPALPDGVTIKKFGSIDGNGGAIFFLATLQGTGITPRNNNALCAALADGSVRVLVRKGQDVNGKAVTVLGTLVGSRGTLAEGRWRLDDTTLGVVLTFTDKSQSIYSIPATAGSPADWILYRQTGTVSDIPALTGNSILRFGLPGFGPNTFATLAKLAANDVALVTGTNGGQSVLLARRGVTVPTNADGDPLQGVTVNELSDPIVGSDAQVAFMFATNKAGFGTGIGFSEDGSTWSAIANRGALAPGGGHWASFASLALPNGTNSGPLFLAKLKISKSDGVIAANNLGLWGVDGAGKLQLLLRTGQSISFQPTPRVIKSFTTLAAAPGSIGAGSGFDDSGNVSVLATFTDGSKALLKIHVP